MIRPGTGRGTMRSMVEGTRRKGDAPGESPPSAACGNCNLAMLGRVA
jgi:hypothetical protein